ncbi:MAG: hypothetical protein HFI33_05395 [Lachnospiraceae bacterium]|nr:hypothetical protein [Lachnospiraceae bacterium]
MQLKKLSNQGIINENIYGSRISFLAGCIVGDELYFSSWLSNGFYKMDLKTGICEFLDIFENEIKSRYLHNQAIFFEDAIWMIPTHAGKDIVKINIKTLEKVVIHLPENGEPIRDNKGNITWEFKCCYKNGSSEFWLVPLGYNMFLRVDMLTNQVIEYSELRDRVAFKDGKINFADACLVGDDIWFYPYDSEELVIFNTRTEKFRFILWKDNEKKLGFVRTYKEWMIFLSRGKNKSVLLINKDTFEKKEIALNIEWKEIKEPMYMVVDVIEQFLVLAPFLAQEFVAVNIETGNVQLNTKLHEYTEIMKWGPGRYQSSFIYGPKIIYASDIADAPLMVFDYQTNVAFYIHTKVNESQYRETIYKLYNENTEAILNWVRQKGSVIEEREVPLLLTYLLKDDGEDSKIHDIKDIKTDGERIFSCIK